MDNKRGYRKDNHVGPIPGSIDDNPMRVHDLGKTSPDLPKERLKLDGGMPIVFGRKPLKKLYGVKP